MNKTFAVVILASASLCALFCVSWWGDVFSERNTSPMGFSVAGSSVPALSITDSSITGSSIAASSAAEPGISARDNIQRQQHSASASSENVASAPVGINLHE